MTPDLLVSIQAALFFTTLCWLLSVTTGNFSQVDRLWSILPILYVAWFASRAGFHDARLNLLALLTALWGVRLTFNFARKGGYHWSSEDYRWPILRQRMGPWKFQLFNATFIAPCQNFILWTLALPAYVALRARAPFSSLDAIAGSLYALALLGETIADEQQWKFQSDKQRRRARGEPVDKPFLDQGLFAYSRHPNFLCEQLIWWCAYLFAVSATGRFLNWGLPGPSLLTLLFLGSSRFTEELTLSRYPAYAAYQQRVPRQLPFRLPGLE